MYLGDKESFKIGDIVSNDKHDNMTVINVFDSEKDTYNGHPIKQLISKKNMQQNGMFGGQSNMGGMFGGMFGQQPTNTDK